MCKHPYSAMAVATAGARVQQHLTANQAGRQRQLLQRQLMRDWDHRRLRDCLAGRQQQQLLVQHMYAAVLQPHVMTVSL